MQLQKITPCLWFDDQAEEAARFYTSIFKNSRINSISRYGKVGQEIHGRTPGSVMVVAFEIDGLSFTALNGGPMFKLSEAVSFQVGCESQEEVDYFWNALSAGGDPAAQSCGWLKDRFGASWQIVPNVLTQLVCDLDCEKSQRAMAAMLEMGKLDISALQRAYEGLD